MKLVGTGGAADHAGAVIEFMFRALPSADGAGSVFERRVLAAEKKRLLIIIFFGRNC